LISSILFESGTTLKTLQVLDYDAIKIKAGTKLTKNARTLASVIIMQTTAEIVYCS